MTEPFIELHSGRRFCPLNPVVSDIDILDIAHALSLECRFANQAKVHYSVAQHSCLVAQTLVDWGEDRETVRWGILHDAHEAYLCDIPSPMKEHPDFAPYREVEARVQRAVCERFGLPEKEPEAVRRADKVLLATEARDLMPFREAHWRGLTMPPLEIRIRPWAAHEAKSRFLQFFRSLA